MTRRVDRAERARRRLLYVEDDPVIAGMTVDVLSEVYDVVHESDGTRARDRALRERFDAMVIDRRLPGLDGVALVEAIRTARITTPVLLLTALGSVADRVDGLDAGANDYLVKPFDFDELHARLRALLRGYRAHGRRRDVAGWTFVEEPRRTDCWRFSPSRLNTCSRARKSSRPCSPPTTPSARWTPTSITCAARRRRR